MHRSQKADMRPDEVFNPAVSDLNIVEPYVDAASAVDEIVEHVTKMVAEHGNGDQFDPRAWVNHWLDRHVPALGGMPRGYLGTAEGRALVKNVLDMSWSGAYA